MLYRKYLLIFALSFFSFFAYAKTLVLGTTDWPPYIENNPTYKGYAYEIVKAAFNAAGYNDVKIIFMPWVDAERAVNEGQLDGIFPEYFSSVEKNTVDYTHPFSESPVGFYTKRQSNLRYPTANPEKHLQSTLETMKNYRFGLVEGYVNISALDQDTQLNKIYADSDLNNLKQLYDGKVDLAFIDKYTAEYLLNHILSPNYNQQLVFMSPPLGYKKLYVAISKKNPEAQQIVADFNQGLKTIKKNGIFARIMDRDAEITKEHIG